ncbi:hypothetical protein V8B97DRAFT_1858390, partial [Scleroderma yunnanense]
PLPTILGSQYIPPPACLFMDEEIWLHLDCASCHTIAHAIVYHPPGAIMEYPQTGSHDGESITHIFTVDPKNFNNLKASFQYSLGNTHGGHFNVTCGLLCNKSGDSVICNMLRTSFKGLKVCSQHGADTLEIMHSFVSHVDVQTQSAPLSLLFTNNTWKVVFDKMLTFFLILHQQGCSFHMSGEAT